MCGCTLPLLYGGYFHIDYLGGTRPPIAVCNTYGSKLALPLPPPSELWVGYAILEDYLRVSILDRLVMFVLYTVAVRHSHPGRAAFVGGVRWRRFFLQRTSPQMVCSRCGDLAKARCLSPDLGCRLVFAYSAQGKVVLRKVFEVCWFDCW